jgi:hypothetical protein
MLSFALAFSCSSVHPAFATPITGIVEPTAGDEREERREDLLVRKVAGRAEEDERVGMLRGVGGHQ